MKTCCGFHWLSCRINRGVCFILPPREISIVRRNWTQSKILFLIFQVQVSISSFLIQFLYLSFVPFYRLLFPCNCSLTVPPSVRVLLRPSYFVLRVSSVMSLSNFNLFQLFKVISDHDRCIQWCKEHNLLALSVNCKCKHYGEDPFGNIIKHIADLYDVRKDG